LVVLPSRVVHEELEKQLDHRVAAETAALIDEGDDGPNGVAKAIARREAARSTPVSTIASSMQMAAPSPESSMQRCRLNRAMSNYCPTLATGNDGLLSR
jgi:hypothetical protein